MAEYFLGKGYNIKIYDKNVTLSKLSGTNKDYINYHIPHLSELLSENLDDVVKGSDLLVITHKIDGVEDYVKNNKDKKFIDLVGVCKENYANYEGICW